MKSKLEIYALSVCFSAIICLVISLAIGSYSFLEISAPGLTMDSYTYNQYQSNDSYWKKNKPNCRDGCENPRPSEDELTKKRVEAFKIAKASESRLGLQSLLRSALFVLFSSAALFIHWKIAKKCRE